MKCPRAIRLYPAGPASGKNRVSNESDSGDDIQVLEAGLRNAGCSAVDVRAIRARLGGAGEAPAAGVRRRAPRFVSVGDCGDLARRRFAAQRLRRSAVDRAYDSASAAVDGCAALASVRSALPADLARTTGGSVETRGGALSRLSPITVVRPQTDPSTGLLARGFDHQSDPAHDAGG